MDSVDPNRLTSHHLELEQEVQAVALQVKRLEMENAEWERKGRTYLLGLGLYSLAWAVVGILHLAGVI